jgi:hypothetical protein
MGTRNDPGNKGSNLAHQFEFEEMTSIHEVRGVEDDAKSFEYLRRLFPTPGRSRRILIP